MEGKCKKLVVAVIAGLATAGGVANADPLVDLQILGSKTGAAGSYTSSLSGLSASQTVFVEVLGQLAPIGTANPLHSKTITSISSTANVDGINGVAFNLIDGDSATFSNIALGTDDGGTTKG